MREIVYRAKTLDGMWLTGYVVKTKWYLDGSDMTIIIPVTNILYPRCEISSWEQVIPETVGQYTGLRDKVGRRMFEGDILKHKYYFPDGIYYTIAYKESSFMYAEFKDGKQISKHYYPIDDHEDGILVDECVIIGNIHDNPELVKGEE